MSSNDSDENVSTDEENPSELGTKNFWDHQYVTELKNFNDFGDIGQIWFGKKMMDSIVNWVVTKIDKKSAVLDLGCGNGTLLIQLAKAGFLNLTGVDYSASAVDLANAIAASRKASITYKTLDILHPVESSGDNNYYDLLLDKGTYDAISLMEDFGPTIRQRYLSTISDMLTPDGLFLIATCNWTREEIIQHVDKYYTPLEVIPTPSMQFGGKQGNTVSVVVFKKKQ